MGQVFTWDAIRDHLVPNTESFTEVVANIRHWLGGDPSIVCAILFGSVVRGDFNIRSDIDVVAIYDTDAEDAAMSTLQSVVRFAHTRNIPLSIAPCDTEVALTRLHHLGPSFVQHLKAAIDAGGLIKGNLTPLLGASPPVKDEIEWYIRMKLYAIEEAYTELTSCSDERRARILKKTVEAPMHIARKMLIYEGHLHGDSKRAVLEQYKQTMSRSLWERLNCLLVIDSNYTMGVLEQLKKPHRKSYMEILSLLEHQLPLFIEFIRSNILRLEEARV